MVVSKGLKAGTRARLHSVSHEIELVADTGTIVRPDVWTDCYIVRLDQPGVYHPVPERSETIWELSEHADNLELLPEHP